MRQADDNFVLQLRKLPADRLLKKRRGFENLLLFCSLMQFVLVVSVLVAGALWYGGGADGYLAAAALFFGMLVAVAIARVAIRTRLWFVDLVLADREAVAGPAATGN